MADTVAQGLAASCARQCSVHAWFEQITAASAAALNRCCSEAHATFELTLGSCRFALGAAGKVASRALSELAKPPRTDSPAPRSSTSSSVPEQPTWDQGPTFRG